MILKAIFIIALLFLVYIYFFKKNREKDIQNKKKDEKIIDEMVECPSCKTYVSQKEALLSNGKFYCSKECLENK
jgi:uncharacterized protein